MRGGTGRRTFWLVLARQETDVCLKDPGFPVDLVVTSDLETFTRVWMGDVPLVAAMRRRLVCIDGPRELTRAFPGWLALSSFAGIQKPRQTTWSPRVRVPVASPV